MNVVWSQYALTQRIKLLAARAEYAGKASARKADWEIIRLIELATTQPDMGKPGSIEGTRELYPFRYRLVYRVSVDCEELHVLAILPQWQKWPQ